MRLRRRLSVLVVIALVPSLLLTAYNAARWRIFIENETRATALSEARFASSELEQIIDDARQVITAIAKFPVNTGNEAECASNLKSIISDVQTFSEAAIFDTEGNLLCSTSPFQALDVNDRTRAYQSLKANKLDVGTIVQSRTTQSTSILLSMPYKDAAGSIGGMIVLTGDSGQLAKRFRASQWRAELRLLIIDGQGSLILTLPTNNSQEAKGLAKSIFPLILSAKTGTIDIKDSIGRSLIVGVAASTSTPENLFTAVALDRDSALAETSVINVRGIVLDFFFIILAVIVVWLAAYVMIDRPIRAIIKSSRKWESGDTTAVFPKFRYSDEFGQLSAALTRMSSTILELFKQKDLLLRELQHRVMNSLTLLSSLLEMQRRSTNSSVARESLANARDRVIAMGTVYRQLYQTQTLEYVEFSGFLKTVCTTSGSAYVGAKRPSIEVEADSLELSSQHAISLGMLTHELITNALKHAFSESETGSIKVTLKHKKRRGIDLSVADRGRGLPSEFKIDSKSSSLGMKIVASTVRQLSGTLEINRLNPGTEFVIHLPANIART
jgi:two-component sensor histidine kinase